MEPKNMRWRTLGVIASITLAVFAVLWLRSSQRSRAPAIARSESVALIATRTRLGVLGNVQREVSALRGQVRSGTAPVAGALVCAACLRCEPTVAGPAPCRTSGDDGEYAFADLTPGGYFIHATAAGFVPGTANRGEPVFVAADRSLDGVDIELDAGGARLTGTVVDATGGPVAAAHVRAVRIVAPRISLDTRTDEHGRFALPLRPGFIQLVAEAPGYARAMLRATAPGDVELRLVPGSSVEGMVVLAGTNTPLGNIEVKAISASTPQPELAPSDISDGEGRFRIERLLPGAYAFDARGSRYQGQLERPLELGVAEHAGGVLIEVRPASEVAGRVLLDRDERPCRQGSVSIGDASPLEPLPSAQEVAKLSTGQAPPERAAGPGQEAAIQDDGSVHFPGVVPGHYFVRVACNGHRLRSGPRVIEVGDEPLQDVTWTVVASARAHVHLVDERGEPVTEADVFLEFPSRGPRIVSSYRSDERGRVLIEDLAPGSYKLHAPSGYDRVEPAAFTVQEQTGDVEVTLQLPGSGYALVHVSDEAGKAIDGLWLKAAAASAQEGTKPVETPALAMGAGAYRLGPLAEGLYDVALYDGVNPPIEGHETPGTRVRVNRAQVVETRIQLQRSGAIEGRIVDQHGEPARDVWVSVMPDVAPRSVAAMRAMMSAQAASPRVLSDEDGRFAITGLSPSSSFRVRAAQPYGSAATSSSVRPGQTVTLRLAETTPAGDSSPDRSALSENTKQGEREP